MNKPVLRCSEAAAAHIRPSFGRRIGKQECFMVVPLDARNRAIRKRPLMVALGTASSVTVHPRDVFREAVKANAVSVIVAHNHPSGDVDPSEDDIALTARLKRAGDLLGITLLDHLILAPGGKMCSLSRRGLL